MLGPHNSYSVNDSYQSIDFTGSTSTSSTVNTQAFLASLANLLSTIPQITSPIAVNGSVQWRQRITISAIDMSFAVVGAQGTALSAGDLYNFTRLVVWETRDSYSLSPNTPLVGVHVPLNNFDCKKVHYDEVQQLPTQAFNSGDYNAPGMYHRRVMLPINQTYDWFTRTVDGSGGWDTKTGNILCSFVSDSALTPHPTIWFSFRVYFRMLKIGSKSNQGQ